MSKLLKESEEMERKESFHKAQGTPTKFILDSNKAAIPPQLYDTHQAANYLGTTMNTLKQSRNTGLLWGHPAPKFVKMGTAVRYRSETLDEWLDSLPAEKQNTAQ